MWKISKPVAAISSPDITIALDPILSISHPATGEPTAIASTNGISIKLACEVETPKTVTAISGTNIVTDCIMPVPKATKPTMRICFTSKSSIFTTGEGDRFSKNTNTGKVISVTSRNGKTFTDNIPFNPSAP